MKWKQVAAIAFGLLIVISSPRPAEAKIHRNLLVIFQAAGIGAIGGTLIGLISVPFSQNVRTVFMGTSVGLYVGAVAGVYFNANRDDARLLLDHTPSAMSPYTDTRQLTLVQVHLPLMKF